MTERHVKEARKGVTGSRSVVLSLTIILPGMLGGCALPPAIEVLSWAMTGYSYAATGKGVGENAISLAMQQDCGVLRMAVDGGDFCVPYMDEPGPAGTMLAAGDAGDSDLQPAAGPTQWRQTASTITSRYGAAQAAAMPVDL